jgi:hypothetical protein
MSSPLNKKRQKIAMARMEIVAQLYKRGYSFRKIQEEVVARLNMETYSLSTVKKDVDKLLAEWRQNRLADMDDAVQVQVEKINDRNRELWDQWEKSKQDYSRKTVKRKGSPLKGGEDNGSGKINTYHVEQAETGFISLGDVSYLSEIRANEEQRNKLLGLNAPEKKDITGDMSFMGFLMESGALSDTEPEDAKD